MRINQHQLGTMNNFLAKTLKGLSDEDFESWINGLRQARDKALGRDVDDASKHEEEVEVGEKKTATENILSEEKK